jgi:hypothetical protein
MKARYLIGILWFFVVQREFGYSQTDFLIADSAYYPSVAVDPLGRVHVGATYLNPFPNMCFFLTLDSTGKSLGPRQDINEPWAQNAMVVPGKIQSLQLWVLNEAAFWESLSRGRLTTMNGDSLSPNVTVNDPGGEYNSLGGAVWLTDSAFIIAWSKNASISEVKGRIGTLASPFSGNPIILNDSSTEQAAKGAVRIATHERADRFVVTWHQGPYKSDSLLLRLFSKSGSAIGASIVVVPDSAYGSPRWSTVAMYPNGDVCVVWTGQSTAGVWNVYLKRYSRESVALGEGAIINTAPAAYNAAAEVAIDYDGMAVVVWESDEQPAQRIRVQGFTPNGSLIGYNIVVAAKSDTVSQAGPVVTIRNRRVFVVWEEGVGIRGATFRYDPVGISPSQFAPRPGSATLAQNYPNPFNPSTIIRYALPQRTHVTLGIFNTLGQQVAILVDEYEQPGAHEVQFDGGRFASGVYFYRLIAGEFVETKRLLLVR